MTGKPVLNDELMKLTELSPIGPVFSEFNKIIRPTTNVDFTREKSPHQQATN